LHFLPNLYALVAVSKSVRPTKSSVGGSGCHKLTCMIVIVVVLETLSHPISQLLLQCVRMSVLIKREL